MQWTLSLTLVESSPMMPLLQPKDVENSIAKASSSFGRLQKRVWKNHSLRIETKIKVYRAVVMTTLLYGS